MKKVIAIIVLAVVAEIAASWAAAETRMPQKYNVGGFIYVPGSVNYALRAHSDPTPFPVASAHEKFQPANLQATRIARKYLDKFSQTTALMLINNGKIVFEADQGLGRRDSELFSMSVGKSLASLAVGKALCGGNLGVWN